MCVLVIVQLCLTVLHVAIFRKQVGKIISQLVGFGGSLFALREVQIVKLSKRLIFLKSQTGSFTRFGNAHVECLHW